MLPELVWFVGDHNTYCSLPTPRQTSVLRWLIINTDAYLSHL